MAENPAIKLRDAVKVLNDVMKNHADINYDLMLADCLDIENKYKVCLIFIDNPPREMISLLMHKTIISNLYYSNGLSIFNHFSCIVELVKRQSRFISAIEGKNRFRREKKLQRSY